MELSNDRLLSKQRELCIVAIWYILKGSDIRLGVIFQLFEREHVVVSFIAKYRFRKETVLSVALEITAVMIPDLFGSSEMILLH